jgi:hypothetical protein
MGDKGIVYYQSVFRGITNPDGSRPVTYFGKVYRIPRSEHGSMRQLEWELKPEEILAGMKREDGTPIEHIEGGIIERFEIYDQESGDVWVMYRVPYEA